MFINVCVLSIGVYVYLSFYLCAYICVDLWINNMGIHTLG